jgi:hypothetical protein
MTPTTISSKRPLPDDTGRGRSQTPGDIRDMIYRMDVQIAATVYVRADSAEQAKAIISELKDTALELAEQDGVLPISGTPLDDEQLPPVSLSPVMTVLGGFNGGEPEEVG